MKIPLRTTDIKKAFEKREVIQYLPYRELQDAESCTVKPV